MWSKCGHCNHFFDGSVMWFRSIIWSSDSWLTIFCMTNLPLALEPPPLLKLNCICCFCYLCYLSWPLLLVFSARNPLLVHSLFTIGAVLSIFSLFPIIWAPKRVLKFRLKEMLMIELSASVILGTLELVISFFQAKKLWMLTLKRKILNTGL